MIIIIFVQEHCRHHRCAVVVTWWTSAFTSSISRHRRRRLAWPSAVSWTFMTVAGSRLRWRASSSPSPPAPLVARSVPLDTPTCPLGWPRGDNDHPGTFEDSAKCRKSWIQVSFFLFFFLMQFHGDIWMQWIQYFASNGAHWWRIHMINPERNSVHHLMNAHEFS